MDLGQKFLRLKIIKKPIHSNRFIYQNVHSQAALIRHYYYPENCYMDKISYSRTFYNTYKCTNKKKIHCNPEKVNPEFGLNPE